VKKATVKPDGGFGGRGGRGGFGGQRGGGRGGRGGRGASKFGGVLLFLLMSFLMKKSLVFIVANLPFISICWLAC
jgi:hypothetical protein